MNDSHFATEAYLSAKALWKGVPFSGSRKPRKTSAESTYSNTRDPKLLSFVLGAASNDFGWKKEIDQAKIIEEWDQFIGERTAPHTKIVGISDGIMSVQCDSTAWATELRRLRAEILTRLREQYPNSKILEVKFLGPGAPSWKHGPRSVPGRGPRDTYG